MGNNDYIKTVLDIDYIRENKDSINWRKISKVKNLPKEFIHEFHGYLHWNVLNLKHTIDENIVRSCMPFFINKKNKKYISKKKLSIEFMRDYKSMLDWRHVTKHNEFTSEMIEEFKFVIDMYRLTSKQIIPLHFIDEFSGEQLNWRFISANYNFDLNFVDKYKRKLHWPVLSFRFANDDIFIDRFIDHVIFYNIQLERTVNSSFINKYDKYIKWDMVNFDMLNLDTARKYRNCIHWGDISVNPNLTDEFIIEFQDELYWSAIRERTNLSPKIKEMFKDKLNLG
jgi:hypothetical protein